MAKVSVVIPTCNRAEFLRAAIESVLKQTFQDFEIIVVDDGSKDSTPEVVRGFSDPRVQYIRHTINNGQGVTRNDGIGKASGEYIALLDDDDQWLPEKLERQVPLLDDGPSNLGLVYTGFYNIDGSSKRIIGEVSPEKRGHVFRELCQRNWIGTCSTVLLRRVCLEKTGGFDENFASGADYDLWLRISKEFEIDYIREPLVLYTVHDDRISTNHESLVRGLEGLLRKHATYFEADKKNHSRRYSSLGINYCLSGNARMGRDALLRAIALYPFELRNYYHLFLSFFGPDNFKRMKGLRDHFSLCDGPLPSFLRRENRLPEKD